MLGMCDYPIFGIREYVTNQCDRQNLRVHRASLKLVSQGSKGMTADGLDGWHAQGVRSLHEKRNMRLHSKFLEGVFGWTAQYFVFWHPELVYLFRCELRFSDCPSYHGYDFNIWQF